MQERNALDSRMNALTEISRELSDNLELAEMAEDEGDTATLDEAARALVEARKRAETCSSRRCSPARPTATTPIWRSMPGPAAPRARTGP